MSIEAMGCHMSRAASAEVITPATKDYKGDSRRIDRLLDEALKDTFPASDPPSIAMPGVN